MIHKISFDADHPRLDGEHLARLIEMYLAEHGRRTQAKTVSGYRFKLSPFNEWWTDYGSAHAWILSDAALFDFEDYLHSTGWGWNSRNDTMRRLRQVFRWAHRRGHLSIDFSMYVPAARGNAPAHKPVELKALAAMLAVCRKTEFPERNRAILAVLAGTGLRREECASLMMDGVTMLANDCGYLEPTVCKNDAPRFVAFDHYTGAYLRTWLSRRGDAPGGLFLSRKFGEPLSPSGIYKVVLDCAELAGVSDQVSGPHDLRRMFATRWSKRLRGEGYGQLLQKQLGHSNWETTAIYSLQDIDDVLDVMTTAKVSPIAQLA